MSAKRRRIRFHFWLDINKEYEAEVADTIAELKRERSFSSVLREGILLIADLRRGKVDRLINNYPWIKDAIGKPAAEPDFNGGPGGGDRITRLEAQIQQIERLLIAGSTTPTLLSKKAPAPTPEPDFVMQKETSADAAKNLLGAMSGLM